VATVSSTGVVTAVAAGSATITVTTVDGGKTATCAVTVTDSTTVPVTVEAPAAKSVNGLVSETFAISISPNPFSEYLQLTGTGLNQIKAIRVLNLMGQVVENIQPEEINNRIMLGHNLPTGMYVLQIINGDHSLYNYKIIKK